MYAKVPALGSIIFACHKVHSYSAGKNGSYSPHATQQYYHDGGYLPPLQVPSPYHPQAYPSHPSPSPYSSHNWSASPEDSQSSYTQWTSQNTPMSSSPSISSMRSSTYGQHSQSQQQQHHWSHQPPSYMESNAGYPFPPAGVPYSGTPPATTPANGGSPVPHDDIVPASSRASSRRSTKDSFTMNGAGRGTGNPPVGVPKCTSCGVTSSPEWRKGPSGKKDLCNA